MIHDCLVRGLAIKLDTDSVVDAFREATYATKEPETLDWIDSCMVPGDTLYDIGANLGLYSLYAAARLGGKCSVLAVEPESQNFARLNQNIYINGFSGAVTACCLAVTDALGFGELNIHPYAYEAWNITGKLVSGPAMHAYGEPVGHDGGSFTPVYRQGVMSVSVDSLWRDFGCAFPNHVKIDVDGPELLVVRGMAETLADKRLRSVLVELGGEDGPWAEIRALILSKGLVEAEGFSELSKTQEKAERFAGTYNAVFIKRG